MADQVVSVSFRESPNEKFLHIIVSWTSATGGAVSEELLAEYESWARKSRQHLSGFLEGVITVPDSSDAPDDNYDIKLMAVFSGDDGANSVDLLGGAGTDRDASDTESCQPLIGGVPGAKPFAELASLTFMVTAAGDEKKGVAIICISRA